MGLIRFAATLISLVALVSYSQDNHRHMHHGVDTDSNKMVIDSLVKSSTSNIQHKNHEMNMKQHRGDDENMTSSYSLSLPMNRNGSGTGWLPDSSPMYGYMHHTSKWMFMFHGSVFVRYTSTDITKEGSRGLSKWDAPNWFMGMAQTKVGNNGLFRFGLMMSLDRLTEGGNGYPLLYQSGETWEGKPLVDRQHPHDLFSELSIAYTRRLSKEIDVTGYFGYPGEPALGPVAFMHRVSSSNNPDAPLSHHWQDATHITFGVGTLGIRYGIFRAESSIFTGREPNENRYNFDKAKFDSYSYRISVNPIDDLALQFSQGFIESPEALEPDVDVTRTTASIIHSRSLKSWMSINTTAAWGLNNKGHDHKEHSFLIESNLQVRRAAIYGRYEFVQKAADELALTGFDDGAKFDINALTIGGNYRLLSFSNTDLSFGLQGSIYFTPKALQPIYGKYPLSAQMYLKLSPALMTGSSGHSKNNRHKH